MKKLLRKFIEQTGYTIVRPKPREKVQSFIQTLCPIPIDKKLIRLGPDSDGGYLIPDDTGGIKACFSPGVDNISEFEKDCLDLGMNVYMADKSIDLPNWDIAPNQYNFIKKHIGCTNNSKFITMDDWVNSAAIDDDGDLLLQMDIEGGEYVTLINMSDSLLQRFRILVIEFHELHHLWITDYFALANVVFNKILQTHSCVHIHPNNWGGIDYQYGTPIPRVAEFTFLRNDRVRIADKELHFPHELDFDNSTNEHVVLPESWQKRT